MASEADVEVVREMLRRFAVRENEGVFALLHPDVVWDTTGLGDMAMVAGVYHGHEGMRRFWADWFATFRSVEFDFDDVRAGTRGVIGRTAQRTTGRLSGAEVDMPLYWIVYTLEDGLVISASLYGDHDGARRAAGIG
jgi:ketosteroid isomerase-like protein